MIYLTGSLRNPGIPLIAREIRERTNMEVFDDWFSPGPRADEYWREHERKRGRRYEDALFGEHAVDVFEFDKRNLDASEGVVMVLPAGRSSHLELGYAIGKEKWGAIYFSEGEPERWDIMYQFANKLFFDMDALVSGLIDEFGEQPNLVGFELATAGDVA